MSNHPVHVIDEDSKFHRPTAMIPFCEIAENISLMGIKLNQYDVPFCKSFRPRIIKDQLCYEVNPNKYKDYMIEKDDYSLRLYIDLNEDREIRSNIDFHVDGYQSSDDTEPKIIIGTIGEETKLFMTKFSIPSFRPFSAGTWKRI